jgi:hypothetical protein
MRKQYQNDLRFVIPCMMLLGHAIEVYLKAWLSAHGYAPDTLRRSPFGHDLRRLYEEARQQGLPEPPMPPQHSFNDLVESYEKDHGDYSLRYPQEGWTFAVPKVDALFAIFNALDSEVGLAVNGHRPNPLDWTINPSEEFRVPSSAE